MCSGNSQSGKAFGGVAFYGYTLATDDSLASLAFRRLNLRRTDLPNLAAIVAEPFRLASSRVDNERQSWRHDVERKYLQYFGLKKLCVVDSASLCLFANSLTSGVVVNIGFGVTFVVPVLGGHVKRDAVKVWPVGGMTLTPSQSIVLRNIEPKTKLDIEAILREHGVKPIEEIDAIFHEIDNNNSGSIEYKEVVRLELTLSLIHI